MPPNITKAVEEHIADLKRQIAPLQRQLSAAEEYLKALVQGNEAQALEKGKRIAPPKRKGHKLAQHGKRIGSTFGTSAQARCRGVNPDADSDAFIGRADIPGQLPL